MAHSQLCIDEKYLVVRSDSFVSKYADLDPEFCIGLKSADPYVFPVFDSVTKIIKGYRHLFEDQTNRVGFIMVGESYPKKTTEKILETLNSSRRVSPIQFINANAGAAISYCCTKFLFRGPTLNISSSTESALAIADLVAGSWLDKKHAYGVFCINTAMDENGSCGAYSRFICENVSTEGL
jgi:hypothetical protein